MTTCTSSSPLPFCWGKASHSDAQLHRSYYKGFTLQNTSYSVGDSVFMLPEDAADRANYIGRIVSAFADTSATDSEAAYSIEVRWFEQMGKNREVIELDEAEVNPIGCLAGKATVLCATGPEEAERMAHDLTGEWFFCRGVFNQSRNEFIPYHDLATPAPVPVAPRKPKRTLSSSDDECEAAQPATKGSTRTTKRSAKARRQHTHGSCSPAAATCEHPASSSQHAGPQPRAKSLNQHCVECGATQTPQWREGPAGPKTLCNACGVRYNRMRSSRKAGGGGRQAHMRAKASKAGAAHRAGGGSACAPLVPGDQHKAASPGKAPQQQGRQRSARAAGAKRPVRQAALVSANRNAAFARMGMFEEEEEEEEEEVVEEEEEETEEEREAEDMNCDEKCGELLGGPGAGAGPDAAALSSRSDGDDVQAAAGECSLTSSQSTVGRLHDDDKAKAPLQQQQQQQQQQPAAAAALLSAGSSLDLRLHQDEPLCSGVHAGFDPSLAWRSYCSDLGDAEGAPASPSAFLSACTPAQASWGQEQEQKAAEGPAPAPPAAAASAVRGAALRALGFCADAADFGEVFARFEAAQAALPAEAVQSLLGATQLVDMATSEAASAEAALEAVAKVLESRQRAADASRERAAGAVDALKQRISDLLRQHCPGSCGSPRSGGGGDDDEPEGSSSSRQDLGQVMLGLDCSKLVLPWAHQQLDQDHCMSLLDNNPLVGLGAADNGAALLSMDSGFGSMIKV